MNEESGFTLVELMFAITIGLGVIAAATSLLTGGLRQADAAQRRADAFQRARVAVDAVTRDLRSQTCATVNGAKAAPIVSGTTTSISFFSDFSEAQNDPRRRTLTLDNGRLTETIAPVATGPATVTRTLARDMGGDADGVVFTYFGFNKATGAADTPLAAPLTSVTAPTVARIGVSLRGLPTGRQDGTRITPVTADVFVRLVDPDAKSVVPLCA